MIHQRGSRLSRCTDLRICGVGVVPDTLLGTNQSRYSSIHGSFQSACVIRRSAGRPQGRVVRRRRSDFRTGEGCFPAQAARLRSRQLRSELAAAAAAGRAAEAGRSLRVRPPVNTARPTRIWRSAATIVFVGNYNGINFYDIDNPAKIKLTASLVCPGGQGDVSVYGHLLFMSAEAMNGRIDCGTQGVPLPAGYVPPPPAASRRPSSPASNPSTRRRPLPPPSPDRFRGVRIFDISDLSNPQAGGRRAKLPRIAHAHAGDRPQG